MDQEQKTREFFNSISAGYKKKYETLTPFHHYFFNERLQKATARLDFNHKKVLDIGSGTGNLYDYMVSKFPLVDFYATDICEGMLRESNVPATRKFAGHCYELPYPEGTLDYIFLLGVTTYMSEDELDKTLDFMASRLKKEGIAILTFTNKRSWDYKLRKLLKKPLQLLFKNKGSVLMQDFAVSAYSLEEIRSLVKKHFRIEEIDYLNHTVFPFNFLFPKFSLARAKKIQEATKSKSISFMERNSSDYLIKLSVR